MSFVFFAGAGAEYESKNNTDNSNKNESKKPDRTENNILCDGRGVAIIINCLSDGNSA